MTAVSRYLLVAGIVALLLNALLLYRNTYDAKNQVISAGSGAGVANFWSQRPRGAFYALVRNRELGALLESMRDVESTFNNRADTRYPYVFLNDEPFTDRFMRYVRAATKADIHFGLVPAEEWDVPSSFNMTKAKEEWEKLAQQNVLYARSKSYRQMCRYQSGFFMNHELLRNFDYAWRIEPGVSYFCKMSDEDPFRVMRDGKKKYGWAISLREDPRTVPSLYKTALQFRKEYPQYARNTSMLPFSVRKFNQGYNMCHFEITDLNWLRSEEYQAYFQYLSKTNGFFSERWGDAPVRSLAVSLFLEKDEVHYFNEIGYRHPPIQHCPIAKPGKCACVPDDSLSEEYSPSRLNCLFKWEQIHGKDPDMEYERLRVLALET
ncbi:uncharacterized protein MJAP1_000050 [Malassezia japonica]|uniref:Uncharacterized protein n=1 Tax=Malassezia japonica TaxID=223818 RepID=A0AAF0J8A8_9BASI|nr:uncharacterized protein MJAP1_000050 [Malassezia japonica]WFD37108.1 hypothetical protein MJAP1_000050 [Malassezia japonica]